MIHIDLVNDNQTTPMLHKYQERNLVLIPRPPPPGEPDMALFDLADFIVRITNDT